VARRHVGTRPGVAVDTTTGDVVDLSTLEPRLYDARDLGRSSDWAVAVGEFEA